MTFPSALAMCVLVLYSTVSPFIQGKCHVIRNNKKQLLTAAQKNLTLKWRFRCRSGGRSNTLVRTEISQHLLDQFLWLFFTDIHGPRSVTTSDIQTPRDFCPSTTMRFDIREVKCLDNYLRGWNIPYVRWESPHSKHRCLTRTPTLLSIFFRLTEADTQISIFSSMVHAVLVNWVCFAQVVFVTWLQCNTFRSGIGTDHVASFLTWQLMKETAHSEWVGESSVFCTSCR